MNDVNTVDLNQQEADDAARLVNGLIKAAGGCIDCLNVLKVDETICWIVAGAFYKTTAVFLSYFPVLQVDRHLRKLDQELAKFKMELEADNAGITEILERRKSLTGF